MRHEPDLSPERHGTWTLYGQRLLTVLPSFPSSPLTYDQFDAVTRATRASMIGHAINTTIAVVAFAFVAWPLEIAVWAAASYAICAYVFWRRQRATVIHRTGAIPNGQRKERRAILFAVLLALPWSYLSVRYLGVVDNPVETIVISLGVGMAASGAVLLAPIERAAITYMTTILAPTAFKCLLVLGTAQYALLGALAISYWLFLLAVIATTNQLFKNKTQAVERLQIALTETSNAREEIERIAMYDPLTDLANRRAFLQRLSQTIDRSTASGSHDWAVYFLDLDHFKTVNDTLGHKFGDELLKLVANRLRQCVRPTDMVARLGGDEFSIIAEYVPDPAYAEAIALRLLSEISLPFVIQDHSVSIGASIGVATPDRTQLDSEQMLKRADLAMYEAKSAGRNAFKIFELSMQERMDARHLVEVGLRQAIANEEFELYYQPIYDLETLRVARFEALIRWRHPVRGILSPADFLPIAEDIGVIAAIGEWVVNKACRQAVTWPADVGLAVNLSPLQVNHASIVNVVESALTQSGLSADRLELEITETALLSDTLQTRERLEDLKGLGTRLSMDDFGTGYSSLSYLTTFPLDGIKIDKRFIAKYAAHSENAAIMHAMVDLAKSLKRCSTIEGIETYQQLRTARALGATFAQGYYLSPPRPADTVAAIIKRAELTAFETL